MSRNSILVVAAILAVVAGLLVSYYPPAQNAGPIWQVVSMFIGYGIRDLFKDDAPAAPAAGSTDAPKV